MGDYACFFYGTLIFPQILRRVITDGRSEHEPAINLENLVPAILKGYKRRKVYAAEYPAITKSDDENDQTLGILVKGLTSSDIQRLDLFEGEQYVRTDVEVYVEDSSPDKHADDESDLPTNTNKIFSDNDYKAIEDNTNSILVPAQTYVWIDSPALLEDEDWDPEEFKTKIRSWLIGE